ncbi:MAG TPA: hypothetical protein VGW75_00225 [Solirubrobacteraceae bacterium]|nr:hypothetical protein [Solirubrobacteraceae bacterium]
MPTDTLSIRFAPAGDPAVARLAALDSATAPAGRTLVAEAGGRPVAAIPYDGGVAVADPFARTVAAVELLERWSAELHGPRRSGALARFASRRARWARRAAPAAAPAH